MADSTPALLHFLWAGIARHRQTGGILPSQRFLVAKMIAPIPKTYTGCLVELGAGCGPITLALASKCPAARIVACEINPTLAADNRRRLTDAGIDGRVDVVTTPAEELLPALDRQGIGKPDFIISSIPLRNLGSKRARELISIISESLAPGGTYIQFQHSKLDWDKIMAKFPRTRTAGVLLNIPPAIVYYAQR